MEWNLHYIMSKILEQDQPGLPLEFDPPWRFDP